MSRDEIQKDSTARLWLIRVMLGAVMTLMYGGLADSVAGAQLNPDSPPPAYDGISCGHFESRMAAQEYFDTGQLEDPSILDRDGDGIACEFAFDSSGTEFVTPGLVGCESFASQAEAQEFFDSIDHADPDLMDRDGDGIVCEFAFETDGLEQRSVPVDQTSVVTLPSTGDGAAGDGPTTALVAAVVTLLAGGAAGALRRYALR